MLAKVQLIPGFDKQVTETGAEDAVQAVKDAHPKP